MCNTPLPRGGGKNLHGDAALAGRVGDAAGEADVALVAPEVAPGVLHNPVVGAILAAVPHDQHAVVQRCPAGRVEHAAGVQLELALVGLDRHTDGLVGSCLQTESDNSVALSQELVSPDLENKSYNCGPRASWVSITMLMCWMAAAWRQK